MVSNFAFTCNLYRYIQGQLADLMVKLNQTAPHYIRCIKPNGANRPMLFEVGRCKLNSVSLESD
jgi:hypothetical protein